MQKWVFIPVLALFLLFSNLQPVSATSIWLEPADQLFDVGDTLTVDLMADIDPADAILGFGYDLSFDGGSTFVAGPGATGNALTFDSFNPNGALSFAFDPLFDDGDTINGFLGPFDPDVSGSGLTLGTFSFTAFDLQPESLFLSADDVGTLFSEEGLVPGLSADHTESILPNTATAMASPIPEPSTWLLFGTGLLGAIGLGRKKFLGKC